MASFNEENSAAPQREEPPFQNKYGGISPRKPLISKDHERAYFDSADWVLGKQAASNSAKGPTEQLKPKMQRTAYHQLPARRPACTSGGTEQRAAIFFGVSYLDSQEQVNSASRSHEQR